VASPDIGYLSSDDAFAFKPLWSKFSKFKFYQCPSHFFIFGSDALRRTFALLEIHRSEAPLQEKCIVSVPIFADDLRYTGPTGTVVGQSGSNTWLVKLELKCGGSEVVAVNAADIVYDGAVTWAHQDFPDEHALHVCHQQLAAKYAIGSEDYPNFDGIIGFARFTEGW
jgi:hypothetical protein